ncbi:MAG: hypothetical protein K0Q95_2452 [Bacteroidota bacterium]|jgi:hypothetical protein|nr:hypothetical protein [Bacteroidota bacterium]
MKTKLILNLLLIAFLGADLDMSAQDSTMLPRHPPKERIIDRMFTGGNLGAQFGTVTFIEISPLVGYRFTDKISAGIGATYQYYHYNDKIYNLETNVYGGRLFGRYLFTDYLFGHAEYEYLNLEAFDFQRRRVDVESVLVGGGYIQRISDRIGIVAMILFNLTETAYTPYTNPIIRVGVNFGI